MKALIQTTTYKQNHSTNYNVSITTSKHGSLHKEQWRPWQDIEVESYNSVNRIGYVFTRHKQQLIKHA